MATITIDPLNRIEGHLKAVVTTNPSGLVLDAAMTGNLFRGFENILNRRDPRDAPIITQRICGVCPTSHAMSSVMCLDTALAYTNDPGTNTPAGDITSYSTSIPLNGLLIRNIIHGMDTVMSHITHFYHLSAPDFIDFSTGAVPMSPWLPSYTTTDLVAAGSGLGPTLIGSYVTALKMRRLAHTAGALFSGRQPIQNALVPGGVTSLFDATYPLDPAGAGQDQFGPYNATSTLVAFNSILTSIRNFIDQTYIPNVLTVATQPVYAQFWSQGAGCQRVMSYGAFPMSTAGTLLLKRGTATPSTALNSVGSFNQGLITEYVDYSWYDYGFGAPTTGLHPFDGQTTPHLTTSPQYSWLKAPRYNNQVHEVGPLARLWITYNSSDTSQSVASLNLIPGILPTGGSYSVRNLVTNTVGVLSGLGLPTPGCLFSVFGRHACRALEAKLLADACAAWSTTLATNTAASCYDYKKIPKTITKGYGLIEVPRGSLGHWIKIEGRKIAKYQCVVPTTWNASPRTSPAMADHGPAEQALMTSIIGPDSDPQQQIVNILRILHPFDFCIACAVHVVSPEGKDKLKFAIGADGKPVDVEIFE
jgi:hydrogenase large subunit